VSSGSAALKKYRAGTHRVVSPAQTLDRLTQFFHAFGITRVADITGLDVVGIPVITVCRPDAKSVVLARGKGLDLTAAKVSGVMESIEACTAERIDRPLLLGSVNDLRASHPLVDVGALPRPVSSLYRPDLPILWIEGQELCTRTPRWVPYEMVHAAYTLPAPSGTGCFVATSNGLASGNHLLEAISHGLCEVVERDAGTLHSVRPANATAARRIDPRTVDDAGCLEALARFRQAGISAEIWDMTTDIGIPAFMCQITQNAANAEKAQNAQGSGRRFRTRHNYEGLGCHPDRGVALLRALTEAAQSRLASISLGHDELSYDEPGPTPTPAPTPDEVPMRDFTAVPAFDGDSIDDDVAWELDALRSAGIDEVVVVNLTRAEFGIPVVRVIVPGLEGPTMTVPDCRLGRRAMNLIGAR
jgi:YcaO-like protein with predicted kinase domain